MSRLDKLRLLWLNNDNDNEAAVAKKFLDAQLLLDNTDQRLEANGSDTAIMTEPISNDLSPMNLELARVIGHNFRCYVVIDEHNRQSTVAFMGTIDDLDLAIETYHHAFKVMHYQACNWWLGQPAWASLTDYCMGFIQGLEEQYKTQVERSTLPMLTKIPALVDFARKHGVAKNVEQPLATLNESHAKGRKAGTEYRKPLADIGG